MRSPSQTQIGSTNDQFTLSLDGKNTTLTLADGTYSQDALAQMLQSAINSDSDLSGRQISVGVQGGQLTFTSASFGSSSQVSIGSGNANAAARPGRDGKQHRALTSPAILLSTA